MKFSIRYFFSHLTILSLSLSLTTPVFSAEAQSKSTPIARAQPIKASGGENCFKSLDAKDMANLSSIIDVREDIAQSMDTTKNIDIQEQKKAIDARFSGEKRIAAYAALSFSIAEANKAAMDRVLNQALAKGEKTLSEAGKKQISGVLEEARKNGVDLEATLNLRLATIIEPAEKLKAKGAKILPDGQWSFGKNFNFAEVKNNPELKAALSAFFPDQVEEISKNYRGYTRIGDRVITNIPDPAIKHKGKPTWVWASEDLETHVRKSVEIMDRFAKKAEEFARVSKENGHWVNVTMAALDADMTGGVMCVSMMDILGGPVLKLGRYFTGDNNWDKWDGQLDYQSRTFKELGELQTEMLLHGTTPEVFISMNETVGALNSKSDEEMDAGIKGMKRALTAIALSPLAVIGAPVALGGGIAAATTTTGTVLAVAGTAVTVGSLTVPVVIAARNINKAIKSGDGSLCSVVKHGAVVPVSFVETLRWSAMGPVLKGLSPVITPVTEGASRILNLSALGPEAAKYAPIIPGVVLSGWGVVSSSQSLLSKNEAIENFELALKAAKESGNTRHAAVLEEMIQKAKDERWDDVLSLANSTVGLVGSIHDITRIALEARAAKKLELERSEVSSLDAPDLHTSMKDKWQDELNYAADLKEQFKADIANGKIPEYDVVIVGTGPHAVITANSMRQKAPNIRILMIEGSDGAGTFQKMGDSFRLNSQELPGASGNNLSGLPLQPSDLHDPKIGSYPLASTLGDATIAGKLASGSHMIVNERVNDVSKIKDGVYQVKTIGDIKVNAKAVFVATGLGDARVKLSTPAGENFVRAEEALAAKKSTYSPRAETVDTYLARETKAPSKVDLSEKVIVVAGQGDGGKIAVEKIHKQFPNAKIIWLGQEAATAEEYLKSVQAKVTRYGDISKLYDKGVIVPVKGRLSTTGPNGAKKVSITYNDPIAGEKIIDADKLVLSIGYENTAPDMLKSLGKDTIPITVNPTDHTHYKTLGTKIEGARQVQGENVFMVGNAVQEGNDLWKVEEVVGGFLDVKSPLTAATAADVVDNVFPDAIAAQKSSKFTTSNSSQGPPTTSKIAIKTTTTPLKMSADDSKMFAKIQMSNTLRSRKFEPNKTYSFTVNKEGKLSWKSSGGSVLDQASLDEIAAEFNKPELRAHLESMFSKSAKDLTIEFNTRSDSLPKVESFKAK